MNLMINNFETIETIVPNGFFIQNYSSRKTETLKIYTEVNDNSKDKLVLEMNDIFINQTQFTGKYYDYALLIFKTNSRSFILYLFQVSKKKIELNRYYREEHKIIFNRVKEYLEKKCFIKIDEGHFAYILLYEDEDKKTISFCKENSLKYYLFSVKNLKFMNENLLFDNESLITKEFPIHSSFSILHKKFFEKDTKGNIINIQKIKDIEKLLKFEKISNNLNIILNQNFILKNPKTTNESNEFLIAGHFDEKFDINYNFCIWFDNLNLNLIYIDKNQKVFEIAVDNAVKLSNSKFTLICSKYKVYYFYSNN